MIDWDKAPEGATHWDELGDCFCDKRGLWMNGKYYGATGMIGWGTDRYTPRPTPVYTQEMADNGELPCTGSLCQGYILADTVTQGVPLNQWIDGVYLKAATSANGGRCFLFKGDNNTDYVINAASYIRPIDTRTDEQKAIDDVNNILLENEADYTSVIVEAIKAGRIHGVTWSVDK